MTGPQVETLARYDALAGCCLRMLDAAQRGDWPEVADIESQTRLLIAELRERRATVRLDDATRQRKFLALRDILSIDAQIRRLSDPGAKRLDQLFAMSPAQRADRGTHRSRLA